MAGDTVAGKPLRRACGTAGRAPPLFKSPAISSFGDLQLQNRPMNETRPDTPFEAASPQRRSDARVHALMRSGLLERTGERQFTLIAEHVRMMLGVPVALVTLVGSDRQFFAASPGLGEPWAGRGETPLDLSFCRHVVEEGAPAVVPDARLDPDFCHNGAIEALGVVAYLGVPLRLPGGEVVGALAAIDSRPRAWSDGDLERLSSAAGLVMGAMTERLSDARWRTIFEQLEEAFILGRVVRDAEGRVVDWVYEEVNRAWYTLTGIPEGTVIGRSIRQVLPQIEAEWIDDFAVAVETGQSHRFTRRVGTLGRWYEGIVRPLGDDRFTVIFLEVSDRIEQEEALRNNEARVRTLVESIPIGVLLAEAPSGRLLVANRRLADLLGLGVGPLPTEAGGLFLGVDEDGRPLAADEHPLARIVSGKADAASQEMRIALPENGSRWIEVKGSVVKDARGRTVAAVVTVSDIEDRKRDDAQRTLLNHELAHRLKNTLAVVQSIATQTLRGAPDLATARASLSQRIRTLSQAHDILLAGRRDAGSVEAILRAAVSPHDPDERIVLRGPAVMIGPKAALALALVGHELATNAVKYGALSVPGGIVSVTWALGETEGQPILDLLWSEAGGPPVAPPQHKGFGTRLIEMGLPGSASGSVAIDYAPAGLRCRLEAQLTELQSPDEV